MWNLQQEIEKAAENVEISLIKLNDEELKVLTDQLTRIYCNEQAIYPLWEQIQTDSKKIDPEGWRVISKITAEQKVILFAEPSETSLAYKVSDGSQLEALLSECHPFVFYVSDNQASFLLSFTDHDVLIAAGQAEKWFKAVYPT